MRKLIKDLFYIPKYGKICDKAMMMRVITTVATVVICLSAMGISAYAYFSCNVASNFNMIKAAIFVVKLQITDEDALSVEQVLDSREECSIELKANESYKIVIAPTKESTANTGFLAIKTDKPGDDFHTQQLGKNGGNNAQKLSFKIQSNVDTTITFKAYWGTSPRYAEGDSELYVVNGETVDIVVAGVEATVSTPTKPEAMTPPPIESTTENTIPETTVATEPEETTSATEPSDGGETTASTEQQATEPALTETTTTTGSHLARETEE